MAFCNSCGATMDAGTKFCNKCGAAQAAPAAPAPATATTTTGGGGALKIILIVIAIVVGLGILSFGAMAFFVHRAISRSHIEERNGKVKIEAPGVSIDTSNESDVTDQMGEAMYPGASVVQGSSSTMDIAGIHTVNVQLQTSDSPSTVAAYYKNKMPTTYASSQGDNYSMMVGDKDNMTTLTISPAGGMTHIAISKVVKKQ